MKDYSNCTDRMINREIAIHKGLIPRDSHTFHNSAEMTVDYAGDLSHAFSLATDNPRYVSLETVTTWHSEYSVRDFHAQFVSCEGAGDEVLGEASETTSLARAICLAWLRWQERRMVNP